MADRQEKEFNRLELNFHTLWGRRLQLIDCQNLFCEVGKYARVFHPEVVGPSGRTRIKQKFKPGGPIPRPWFPPKWNINDAIERSVPKYFELRNSIGSIVSGYVRGRNAINAAGVG